MQNNTILALIPAWNEAVHLTPIVEATRKLLPVLVVDDGSQDETADVAARAGAFVIRHERNQGKGKALATGFNWALEHGFKAVMTLDADGQHDPDEIPKFLSAYKKNTNDLIIGLRNFRRMPFPRNYSNPIGSWLLSLALKQHICDGQCGYRLYTERLLKAINITSKRFEAEVEVISQTVCKGMRIGWVKIKTVYNNRIVSHFRSLIDVPLFLKIVCKAYYWRRNGLKLNSKNES